MLKGCKTEINMINLSNNNHIKNLKVAICTIIPTKVGLWIKKTEEYKATA